jgi:hypothetical protein
MLSEVEFRIIAEAIQSDFLKVAENRVVVSREEYHQIGEGGIRFRVDFIFVDAAVRVLRGHY